MLTCCVSGCSNRYSPSSSVKFYRIPSGSRPFQVNRRRLWIEAIQRANGCSGDLPGNVRVCGAHFLSGEATLDTDKPDYVPSVFTCAKQNQCSKKKGKWSYGSRKRRRHRANAETLKKKTPPAASPADLQPSTLMETDPPKETEKAPTPSTLKEEETCKEAATETESENVQLKTSSIQNVTLQSLKVPASISKMSPVVLLKPVTAPTGGFQCELCTHTFINGSELVKHKRVHETQAPEVPGQADLAEPLTVPADQPSFSCNMCDRSFTTVQNLKRHKLLHVKDGRKCLKCGVLFCRRHNHILFHPQPESTTEYEEDSFPAEEEKLDETASPKKNVSDNLKPTQTTEKANNAQTTQTPQQITVVNFAVPELLPKAPPLPSHTRVSLKKSMMLPPMPCPASPILKLSKNKGVSFQQKSPGSHYAPTFVPQHPELPPSLEIFSPRYLTSALLDVKRNYEYILSKPRKKKVENVVKEEPEGPALISPAEQTIKQVKSKKIAYDLEVIL